MTVALTKLLQRRARSTVVTVMCPRCKLIRDIPEHTLPKGDVPICECGGVMLPVRAVVRP